MGNIKAIWFDLDDTLYDHTYSVRLGMDAIRARYPLLTGHSSAQLAAHYNNALNRVYTAHVRGEIEFLEMRRRKLGLFYELSEINAAEAPAMDEFHRIYDEAYGSERRRTPGTPEMLQRLTDTGFSLAILTNGKQAIQEDKLRAIGLQWMIPNLLTAERAGFTKPDPRIYHWALEETGHAAESILMVGDSLENDVEAALCCGLNAALFAPGANVQSISTAHGPAPVISNWTELMDLVQGHVATGATP